jgi:hypothetical protein
VDAGVWGVGGLLFSKAAIAVWCGGEINAPAKCSTSMPAIAVASDSGGTSKERHCQSISSDEKMREIQNCEGFPAIGCPMTQTTDCTGDSSMIGAAVVAMGGKGVPSYPK